eukprot:TRINITY_DN69295_c0_g1_i2.p2 TRINITY_DN69295_c0_g1~~TRINITY_DN69295_c0_g1_i2.p2  ORF type:complete len:105 (+),score=6.69 TRINITY_DN69295_c0_g1_i2:38-352(+)
MDNWHKVDHAEPKYRYFQNRSKGHTAIASVAALAAASFFCYVCLEHIDRKSHASFEKYARLYATHTTDLEQVISYARLEAYRDILYKKRRKMLGLSDRPPMYVA